MPRLYRLILPALLPLALVAGCSQDNNSSDTQAFNDDDVMFAQMMIPHHEQAIEMADIALDPTIGASAQVKELATQIKGAQDPEIMTMKNLLTAWGKPTVMDADVDHSEMMDGMLTVDELVELGKLEGTAFDTAWLEAMIRHHEGAISMANDLLEKGSSTDLRKLAEDVLTGQQAEIDTMRALQ